MPELEAATRHVPSARARAAISRIETCARVVALDFDQTTLAIHAYGSGLRTLGVLKARGGPLSSDFSSLDTFLALLAAMRSGRIDVFIVSFGVKAVIEAYLAAVAPWFPSSHIITPSAVGRADGTEPTVPGVRKNDMLQLVVARHNADPTRPPVGSPSEVLLVDDDDRNVVQARAASFQGYTCPKTGMTDDQWDRLSTACTAQADLVELGGGRRRGRGANAWVQLASAHYHRLRADGVNVTYGQVLQQLSKQGR